MQQLHESKIAKLEKRLEGSNRLQFADAGSTSSASSSIRSPMPHGSQISPSAHISLLNLFERAFPRSICLHHFEFPTISPDGSYMAIPLYQEIPPDGPQAAARIQMNTGKEIERHTNANEFVEHRVPQEFIGGRFLEFSSDGQTLVLGNDATLFQARRGATEFKSLQVFRQLNGIQAGPPSRAFVLSKDLKTAAYACGPDGQIELVSNLARSSPFLDSYIPAAGPLALQFAKNDQLLVASCKHKFIFYGTQNTGRQTEANSIYVHRWKHDDRSPWRRIIKSGNSLWLAAIVGYKGRRDIKPYDIYIYFDYLVHFRNTWEVSTILGAKGGLWTFLFLLTVPTSA
ncbi:hypothetical protein F5Y08DRAFT_171659 [Xylaria arbuscula]|nr:hypothetical protein F5Y08DRAFT_171659 [Xylaria arbuscula]